jgi:alkanesulfonate monooxygenase SsuD/methylene tetrahydromethanopterin reductase-like flavin-dependent oxidoreductase (luciferase family)
VNPLLAQGASTIGARIQAVPHPLRIGAAIPPNGPTFDDVRRAARRAEAVGADSLWMWDPFFQSSDWRDRTAA